MAFNPDKQIDEARERENMGVTIDSLTGQPVARPDLPKHQDEDENGEGA